MGHGGFKASAVNNRVDVMVRTVLRHHTGFVDAFNFINNNIEVILIHRLIPLIRNQNTFAANFIIGDYLGQFLRVFNVFLGERFGFGVACN